MDQENQDIQLSSIEGGKIKTTETWKLDIWSPFSQQHAYSACYLAKRATEFENTLISTQPSVQEVYEHQALVIGSIFAAHAFLESTINDIFIEADREESGDPTNNILKSLKQEVIASMARIWRFGIQLACNYGIELDGSRCKTSNTHKNLAACLQESNTDIAWWPILSKYQLAYHLANEQRTLNVGCFKDQCSSWQHTKLLIDLRNYFTHHRSEQITYQGPPGKSGVISPSNKKDELRKQTRRLRGELKKQKNCKNRLNLRTGIHPLEDLLGAECANRIVEVSFTFANEFSQKTGIELYKPVRELASKRNIAGCGL